MDNTQIKSLIKSQKDNYSLDQEFYTNDDIFKIDLENIFFKQWVFVGHISRIPNIGDYFLFEIGSESIIIIRDSYNIIHAHYNVCRHRGSRICLESEGNKKLLICPYHAWSYKLDGTIQSARLMCEEFDKAQWSLNKCHVKVFEGLTPIHHVNESPNTIISNELF